jgi:dTDP-glucose 4,6-dehydratase
VAWYLENEKWLEDCISGNYLKYYEEMYSNR